jgi:hypothetical protein
MPEAVNGAASTRGAAGLTSLPEPGVGLPRRLVIQPQVRAHGTEYPSPSFSPVAFPSLRLLVLLLSFSCYRVYRSVRLVPSVPEPGLHVITN